MSLAISVRTQNLPSPGPVPRHSEQARKERKSVMRAFVFIGLVMLLAGCMTPPSVTESLGPAAKKLAPIAESPQVASLFKGTFDVLNFTVAESGEHFYLVHAGDRIDVKGGKFGGADLDVVITQAQVDAISRLAADGTLDDRDAFDIMRILFSPIARAFLSGSFLSNTIILRMAGVEDLIHITFWSEGRADTSSVTLMHTGGKWNAVDGLEGRPKRVFRLNPTETSEYMRRVHTTRKSVNPVVWINFVNWYLHWRDRVSIAATTS